AALLVLVALDEIFPGDRMAVADAHALEPDRGFVSRVEQAEVRPVIADRRVQLDGDVHQAERDRAFPESSRHVLLLRSELALGFDPVFKIQTVAAAALEIPVIRAEPDLLDARRRHTEVFLR